MNRTMDADRRLYDVGSKTPVPYARFAAAVNLPHTGRFVKQNTKRFDYGDPERSRV